MIKYLLSTLFIFLTANMAFAGCGEVRIQGEIKKTQGTLTHQEFGDTACYITLVDDNNQRFDEMASFEVCEQTQLIGQRVHLEYEMNTVLAADCEGNMDCGRIDTVILVYKLSALPR